MYPRQDATAVARELRMVLTVYKFQLILSKELPSRKFSFFMKVEWKTITPSLIKCHLQHSGI